VHPYPILLNFSCPNMQGHDIPGQCCGSELIFIGFGFKIYFYGLGFQFGFGFYRRCTYKIEVLTGTVPEYGTNDLICDYVYDSVAEPEPHHLLGAGAVMRCGSGSDNGITYG
jgi:hypothetical protein